MFPVFHVSLSLKQESPQSQWIVKPSPSHSDRDSVTGDQISIAEVIVPSTSHVTRQNAKWDGVLPSFERKKEPSNDAGTEENENFESIQESETQQTNLRKTESYYLMEILDM